MDNITQRYYDKYQEQIEWDNLTHSVYCEITTATLNKIVRQMWEQLNNPDGSFPPPYKKVIESKMNALITLIVEITEKAILLFLAENEKSE